MIRYDGQLVVLRQWNPAPVFCLERGLGYTFVDFARYSIRGSDLLDRVEAGNVIVFLAFDLTKAKIEVGALFGAVTVRELNRTGFAGGPNS